MADKRYSVPVEMTNAAWDAMDKHARVHGPAVGCVPGSPCSISVGIEAALKWLADHPISFTTEQIQSARQKACMGGHLAENYARVFEELQRRMFLAPEPEPLEDLLSNLPEMVRPSEYRSAVIEAFNRGKKFK